jgi:hypothetical protein
LAFLLLLETFHFLHFPLLVHPSAQARLGVFPVFWLLYLACFCCLQSVLASLSASPVIWGHPLRGECNFTTVSFLPHFAPGFALACG